jgi:integrase-like protein
MSSSGGNRCCLSINSSCRGKAGAGAQTLQGLGEQLESFVHYYNHIRPHRALDGRTPLQAYSARLKARPAGAEAKAHFRVRQDKVDQAGKVSLRYMSRLYHIGRGRAHKGRSVRLLIADQSIRIIDSEGELIRELTLDPPATTNRSRRAERVYDVSRHLSPMSRDTTKCARRESNPRPAA